MSSEIVVLIVRLTTAKSQKPNVTGAKLFGRNEAEMTTQVKSLQGHRTAPPTMALLVPSSSSSPHHISIKPVTWYEWEASKAKIHKSIKESNYDEAMRSASESNAWQQRKLIISINKTSSMWWFLLLRCLLLLSEKTNTQTQQQQHVAHFVFVLILVADGK